MLISSLTLADSIARQPARLTANRLRRRERTPERSDQGKFEKLSALYILKYYLRYFRKRSPNCGDCD